jgi:zinc/manganese transport system ATP-binding protein
LGWHLVGFEMTAAIQFHDVTLGYDRHPAVHHLDGVVKEGSLLAVVGPNGAGKSTLLKSIIGILKPLSGSIQFNSAIRNRIAYLPQAADIDQSFPITVFDLISAGNWHRTGFLGGFGKAQNQKLHAALETVGLAGFENRSIGTLSGGQMQRVLFARLLLQDAPVILLDEPFIAVDNNTIDDLLVLIERWHQEKRTIITVLHDMALVKKHFPETLLLAREPVAWGVTADVLSAANLDRARHMIEAHDPHADICARAA